MLKRIFLIIGILLLVCQFCQTSFAMSGTINGRGSSKNTIIAMWNLKDSIVAHWKMNDDAASSTVVDTTGAYDGAYTDDSGAINTDTGNKTGQINGALEFDGTDERVDTGDTFQSIFRDSFSISCWIKPDDGDPASVEMPFGERDATGNDSSIYLIVSTSAALEFSYESEGNNGNNATTGTVFIDGQETWHHVVCVADSITEGIGGKKIYLDGEEQVLPSNDGSTSGVTFSEFTSAENLYIGARNNNGTDQYNYAGDVDDVRIFNRVLTQREIKGLYNSGFGTERLTGYYWKMEH